MMAPTACTNMQPQLLAFFVSHLQRLTTSLHVDADRVVLEPEFWRSQFANTGGVAPIGSNRQAGNNFTVTSGTGDFSCC